MPENHSKPRLRWHHTHCGRLDHGGCALRVAVADNRIVRIEGDPKGHLNRGYVCPKGRRAAGRLTHPDRLRHPLMRTGVRGQGDFRKASWAEALDRVAAGLQRVRADHGARAVAFCQGMPKGLEHFVLIRLANGFGSPNVVAVQDVCHAPREIAGLHTCGFYPVVNFATDSALFLVWGANVTATNEEGGICRLLTDRLRAGAELLVIDPRRTPLAKRARLHLQLRPGTDGALAMAFLHQLIAEGRYARDFVRRWTSGFEELAAAVEPCNAEWAHKQTGVAADDIRAAARIFAAAHPAALAWGNAVEQTAGNYDTCRALVCLMALSGNLDVAGGNIQAVEPPVLSLGRFVRSKLLPDKRKTMIHAALGAAPRLMTVPPAAFRQAVLEHQPYPVRAAYVQCANPMMAWADSNRTRRALLALDFLAVSEIFMTPTAALADVVLPAATHFEFDDIGHYGLGHGVVVARPQVVEPPPECRPDMWILHQLGLRLTAADLWPPHWRDLLDELLAPAGLDFAAFVRRGFLAGEPRYHKYRPNGFRTPSGKVELRLSRAESQHLPPLPGYAGPPEPAETDFPLLLTTAKDPLFLHSSYRWLEDLRRRRPQPLAFLHPETAAASNIEDGRPVVIETRNGTITQTARLTTDILPGVVCAASGWWFPERPGGDWRTANYNRLTTVERLGRAFGTPNLRGINCRLRPG